MSQPRVLLNYLSLHKVLYAAIWQIMININTYFTDVACRTNPCMNGGTCAGSPNDRTTYFCDCPPSHTGSNCESGKLLLIDDVWITIILLLSNKSAVTSV